ncbi:hypothetical protein [Arthrobacter sp. OY3WO11]|uniref:hypothetical protein n=1 Tax=Arthrobacter sp. OY3WO11 TaxID=1835723 RepID=UPI0012E7929B|nr:hypothetical protein [Arthrobacter sp. OY3WO11]
MDKVEWPPDTHQRYSNQHDSDQHDSDQHHFQPALKQPADQRTKDPMPAATARHERPHV